MDSLVRIHDLFLDFRKETQNLFLDSRIHIWILSQKCTVIVGYCDVATWHFRFEYKYEIEYEIEYEYDFWILNFFLI